MANLFSSCDHVLDPLSTLLVTGVSGFIGSHIADQLLSSGYNIRGMTRDAAKNSWVTSFFEKKYGQGKFELIEVPDMTHPDAFITVLNGISGVVHAASDMSFGPDPNQVIPPVVTAALNLLSAAAQHKEIKRFVYTSSCAAATSPRPNHRPRITSDTWNEDAIEQAWRPPPYNVDRSFEVYAASKTQAEKELWAWYNKNKPGFVLNTVLPSMAIGKSLDLVNQGHPSTSGLIEAIFVGNHDSVKSSHQFFFVDVQDCARLHVAALLHPAICGERIFAYAAPYTWRIIQKTIQTLYPAKDFSPELPEAEVDGSQVVLAPRAEGWLKEMGRKGWTTLEESVRLNTEE